MNLVFLAIAILLFIVAGLHYLTVITINNPDVLAFVAFGLASLAASFFPWGTWMNRGS